MSDLKYRLYGVFNAFVRASRKKRAGNSERPTFLHAYQKSDLEFLRGVDCVVNGERLTDENFDSVFFKGDNWVFWGKNASKAKASYKAPSAASVCLRPEQRGSIREQWLGAIENAFVEDGWRNSGLFLTSYIREQKQWALSSWCWTSGAIVRALSRFGNKELARKCADALLAQQRDEGSWIVRYSIFPQSGWSRLTAPNDSAYIARSAMTTVYKDTGDVKYLESAKRCAQWVMDTAFEDGLVRFAFDIDHDRWVPTNILDIGFTADLFAELYRLTQDDVYKDFMTKFIKVYVKTYYDKKAKFFASSISPERKQRGGYFSRGQGWAMEGVSAAYSVTQDPELYEIMEILTNSVANAQLKNGGWPGNFQKGRTLMGEDCKGIPVLAKSLLAWAPYSKNKDKLIASAQKAYDWCVKHTDRETGTITSFTTNGAIEYSPNTSVGILYANAYILEVEEMLRELKG